MKWVEQGEHQQDLIHSTDRETPGVSILFILKTMLKQIICGHLFVLVTREVCFQYHLSWEAKSLKLRNAINMDFIGNKVKSTYSFDRRSFLRRYL